MGSVLTFDTALKAETLKTEKLTAEVEVLSC